MGSNTPANPIAMTKAMSAASCTGSTAPRLAVDRPEKAQGIYALP